MALRGALEAFYASGAYVANSEAYEGYDFWTGLPAGANSPCVTTAPHLPAWRLPGPRPLLRTPERSLSTLEGCGVLEDPASGRPN